MRNIMRKNEESISFRETVGPEDVRAIRALVRSTELFSEEEVIMAGDLVAETVKNPKSGYRFLIAEHSGQVIGYTCYGRVPGTRFSWDLYWIAVEALRQGLGLGHRLNEMTIAKIAAKGGRQVWVETSGRAEYKGTRAFYRRESYRKSAVLKHYYAPNEDKIIYVKVLLSRQEPESPR